MVFGHVQKLTIDLAKLSSSLLLLAMVLELIIDVIVLCPYWDAQPKMLSKILNICLAKSIRYIFSFDAFAILLVFTCSD